MLAEPQRTDREDIVGGAALDEITYFFFGDLRVVLSGKGNRPFHAGGLLLIAEVESGLLPEFKSINSQRRIGCRMDFGGDQRSVVGKLSDHFGQESWMVVRSDEGDSVFTVTQVQRGKPARRSCGKDGPQVGQAFFVGRVLKIGQRHDVEESWSDFLGSGGEGFTDIDEQPLGFIGSKGLIGVGLRHLRGTSRLWRHSIVTEMNSQRAMVIGVLDGVHLGHQALLAQAAQGGCRVLAAAFYPHPKIVLGQATPPPLTTWRARSRELRKLGARVVRLDPRSGLLETSASEFIEDLLAEHRFARLVVGADFRFGQHRTGTPSLLEDLGSRLGFEVQVLKDVQVGGKRVSSSRIRMALADADLELANTLLGRGYEILGRVRAGQQRGRTLGTPTANLHPQTMLPADGVYVTSSRLPGGCWVPSVSFVGTNPTFGQEARKCETHVLSDPQQAVPDGAGWPLQVAFQARVRGAVRFDSPEALQKQIHQDLEIARQHHADHG